VIVKAIFEATKTTKTTTKTIKTKKKKNTKSLNEINFRKRKSIKKETSINVVVFSSVDNFIDFKRSLCLSKSHLTCLQFSKDVRYRSLFNKVVIIDDNLFVAILMMLFRLLILIKSLSNH